MKLSENSTFTISSEHELNTVVSIAVYQRREVVYRGLAWLLPFCQIYNTQHIGMCFCSSLKLLKLPVGLWKIIHSSGLRLCRRDFIRSVALDSHVDWLRLALDWITIRLTNLFQLSQISLSFPTTIITLLVTCEVCVSNGVQWWYKIHFMDKLYPPAELQAILSV